ncbi:hypothetical protein VOLCADRAFT_94713 [Volvox carteri f. nagariensis]|uniref:Uncharacterized protein n=1 Tax=Volvox carteri f. nagariensis TaxID=3068 RepID=D8U5J2_VOLCA|nr:uncharacterized protein VOLCADRAFT_94713 [Volvox carteri f. nagariensis]EFJ45009.1 hypothetical protein VOLCADRAFT_94713 [Volvox carteri f. nagariensis]|eukprot:XP_002953980.1 hypothetical protein VOLCADRAFT_94713 [Volvox carteri f. nagariensis]
MRAWVPGLPSSARLQAISSNIGKSLGVSGASITTTVVAAFLGTIYRLEGTAGTAGGATGGRRLSQAALGATSPLTSSRPPPLANQTQAQCTPCTPAIASAMATSLCAMASLQNCSLVTANCINASTATEWVFPSLPLRTLSVVASDKGCTGYVAAIIGYKDTTKQETIMQVMMSGAVNISNVGRIAPPSPSDIAISAQLQVVVANEPSASTSTTSSIPLVVDSGRVAQGVATAMGLPPDKVSVTMALQESVYGNGGISASPSPSAVALLGVGLISTGGGRVQPVRADTAHRNRNVPTVTLLTAPPPPFTRHGGGPGLQVHGRPWVRSPYSGVSSVRGEAIAFDAAPWRTNYVQPQNPGSVGPNSGHQSASMVSLPGPWRAPNHSSVAAVQRRVATYHAGVPAGPLPVPQPAVSLNAASAAANLHGLRNLGSSPVSLPPDFNSLNMPGRGNTGDQVAVGGGEPSASVRAVAAAATAPRIQESNFVNRPGAFGLLQSADPASSIAIGRRVPYSGLQASSPANAARGSGIYRGR